MENSASILPDIDRDARIALVVGAVVTVTWIYFTWRFGFDFADEGYYWYGAQRVLRGEVPMRDFMAYDIGRYFWTAAVMRAIGDDGILGARIGAAVYQILTICLGVFLAQKAARGSLGRTVSIAFAFVVAMLLNLWVYPYYKVFDYGTSIVIVAMLVLMLTCLSAGAWFAAGILLGIAAIMGRNHGVYGMVSSFLVLMFLLLRHGRPWPMLKLAAAFAGGIFVGFSPTFVLAAFEPGFTHAFLESVLELVRSGETNLARPIPWPWTIHKTDIGRILWGIQVAQGLCFVGLLLVPVLALIALIRKNLSQFTRVHYVLFASAIGGIVYAHYAYSRADLTHLTLSIFPLLLVVLCFGVLIRRPLMVSIVMLAFSIFVFTDDKLFLAQWLLHQKVDIVTVNGEQLSVGHDTSLRLRSAEIVLKKFPNASNNFLAIPDSTSLYAIYKERMPLWEIYALNPRNAEFETAELVRLKAHPPQVVMLSNHAVDNIEARRYSRMHPLIYQWILENYENVEMLPRLPYERIEVYVPKGLIAILPVVAVRISTEPKGIN